jgi:hypothetical protein
MDEAAIWPLLMRAFRASITIRASLYNQALEVRTLVRCCIKVEVSGHLVKVTLRKAKKARRSMHAVLDVGLPVFGLLAAVSLKAFVSCLAFPPVNFLSLSQVLVDRVSDGRLRVVETDFPSLSFLGGGSGAGAVRDVSGWQARQNRPGRDYSVGFPEGADPPEPALRWRSAVGTGRSMGGRYDPFGAAKDVLKKNCRDQPPTYAQLVLHLGPHCRRLRLQHLPPPLRILRLP